MAIRRVQVIVSGRVQGVFFRAECADRARSLGLGGMVRNRPDGAVEAVFEGEADSVDDMIDWCRRGPPLAIVDDVQITEDQPAGDRAFRVTG